MKRKLTDAIEASDRKKATADLIGAEIREREIEVLRLKDAKWLIDSLMNGDIRWHRRDEKRVACICLPNYQPDIEDPKYVQKVIKHVSGVFEDSKRLSYSILEDNSIELYFTE